MKNLKYILVALISSLLFIASYVNVAQALVAAPPETEEVDLSALLEQIQELLKLVASLKAQIASAELNTDPNVTNIGPVLNADMLPGYVFTKNLKIGSENEDVRQLQILLNKDPRTQIAKIGPGSSENESTYFGNLTQDAVVKFQNLYKSEILTPAGLKSGTGFVGGGTLKKLNSLSKVYASGDGTVVNVGEYIDPMEGESSAGVSDISTETEEVAVDDEVEEVEDVEPVDPALLPKIDFTAKETAVEKGNTTKLYWQTLGIVNECVAKGDWSGDKVLGEGSEVTKSITKETNFSLACSNTHGTTTETITVTPKEATGKPDVEFTVEHRSVAYKGKTTLTWDVTGADSCVGGGDWSDAKALGGGTLAIEDIKTDRLYTLTCTNSIGSTVKQVEIDVGTPAVPAVQLSGPGEVLEGSTASVTWTVFNFADSCSATGDWVGARSTTGGSATTDKFYSDKTFVLTCSNDGGSGTASLTIPVRELPPTIALSASPSSISSDGISVIQWSVQNADSCVASGDGWSGSKSATSGSEPSSSLFADTDFTLTCSNSGGESVGTVSVSVN